MKIRKESGERFLINVLGQVTRELAGWYSCAAVSAAGSLVARALLDVPAPTLHPPPVISVRPRNLTVIPDAVALLVCKAEGDPVPRVTWTKDGVELPEDDTRITPLDSGTLQINGKLKISHWASSPYRL